MGSSQEAFLVLKILQDIDTGVGLPTGCVRGGTPGTHPAAVRVLGCQGLRDMSMTATRNTQTPSAEQPFATTAEKYDTESASGKVTGSNFPYREVQRLPGYSERRKPGLAAVDVTNQLASQLADYSDREGCPLRYQKRDVSKYLWMQASRGMVTWNEVLNVVRSNWKRDHHKQISHYFGYYEVVGPKGRARRKKLFKLIRYITQEGTCAGCQTEFQFSDLTLDRVKPGKLGGAYALPNVQLMCGCCNNVKGASYNELATHPL